MMIQELERVQGNGSVDRMMALASDLNLAEADVAHLPHQFAAEETEGCIWYEDHNRLSHAHDWHALFGAEADIALATGLQGIVSYLLCKFWEDSVEEILREPRRSAELSPGEVARRVRLNLWADATFHCVTF